MLDLPAPVIASIQDQSFAHYPGECCGLLFQQDSAATSWRCVALENIADRLHQHDPAEYPRSSRDAFAVNEARMSRLIREAQGAGERWVAFYHSHIDCDAYYSAEDKRYAAPNGVALYPEVIQIVVSCHADRIVDANAFRWNGSDFILSQHLPAFARMRT